MIWGIIGTGTMANRMAEVMSREPEVTLRSAWARRQEQVEEFCRKWKMEKACTSLEELLRDPEIEAVYVATPHLVHCEHVCAALTAGKHVLVEKPMAMSAEETRVMADLARKNHRFLMEAYWTRFFPGTQMIREMISSKQFGEVRHITAEFGIDIPYDANSRFYNRRLGGGSMRGAGIYPVGFTCTVLNQFPVQVSAMAKMAEGVDIRTTAMLRFENDVTAMVQTAYDGTNTQSAMITCENACIYVPHLIMPGEIQIRRVTGIGGPPEIEKIPIPFDFPGLQYELRETIRCIKAGKTESDIMPLEDSVSYAGLFDSIYNAIS